MLSDVSSYGPEHKLELMKCKLKLITEKGICQFSEMINLPLSKHPQLIGGTFWAPVVQKVDNTVHWINPYPLDSAIGFPNTIHWIVIYLVDCTIQRLKNWGHIILEFGLVSFWREQKLERST